MSSIMRSAHRARDCSRCSAAGQAPQSNMPRATSPEQPLAGRRRRHRATSRAARGVEARAGRQRPSACMSSEAATCRPRVVCPVIGVWATVRYRRRLPSPARVSCRAAGRARRPPPAWPPQLVPPRRRASSGRSSVQVVQRCDGDSDAVGSAAFIIARTRHSLRPRPAR